MTPNSKLLVIFEGVDGLGKTTHAKLLAKDLGATLVQQPSGENSLGFLRDQVKNNLDLSTSFRQCLHTMSHIVDFYELFAKTPFHDIVMDRSWLSTYVYGKVQGMSNEENNLLYDIHVALYSKLLATHTPLFLFLDSFEKFEEGETDKFESTFSWKAVQQEYREIYAASNAFIYPNEEYPYSREQRAIIDVAGKSINDVHNEVLDLVGAARRGAL